MAEPAKGEDRYKSERLSKAERIAVFNRQQELFDSGVHKKADFVQRECWRQAVDELDAGKLVVKRLPVEKDEPPSKAEAKQKRVKRGAPRGRKTSR